MSKDFFASGLAGLLSQIISWPTEFLKTNKQLPKYKNISILTVIKNEYKTNGTKSFYRGSLPQIASAFPRSIVRFHVFNYSQQNLQKCNINNTINSIISGILGGSVEAFLVQTPAEVLKVQAINKKQNIVHSFKTIYNLNGLKGFWSGTLPTVIRQGSSQGISFPVFQKAKPIFDQYTYLQPISSLLGGVCGGVTAVFINNPIDLMKTYKQSDRKDKSLVDIAKEIKKTKGIKGFYTGMGLRLLRMAPLHGSTFYFYDILKKYS